MSSFDAMRTCAAGFIVVMGGTGQAVVPTLDDAERIAVEACRASHRGGEIIRADNYRVVTQFSWEGGPFESVALTAIHDVNSVPLSPREG